MIANWPSDQFAFQFSTPLSVTGPPAPADLNATIPAFQPLTVLKVLVILPGFAAMVSCNAARIPLAVVRKFQPVSPVQVTKLSVT